MYNKYQIRIVNYKNKNQGKSYRVISSFFPALRRNTFLTFCLTISWLWKRIHPITWIVQIAPWGLLFSIPHMDSSHLCSFLCSGLFYCSSNSVPFTTKHQSYGNCVTRIETGLNFLTEKVCLCILEITLL